MFLNNVNRVLISFKTILAISLVATVFAGTDGTIRGKIIDEAGDPLSGQVIVLNSSGDVVTGTSADFDGNYLILNVQVGNYNLKCTMIGYKTSIVEQVASNTP